MTGCQRTDQTMGTHMLSLYYLGSDCRPGSHRYRVPPSVTAKGDPEASEQSSETGCPCPILEGDLTTWFVMMASGTCVDGY